MNTTEQLHADIEAMHAESMARLNKMAWACTDLLQLCEVLAEDIPPPLPPARQPCSTARRLALLRRLCEGATCETTRRMVRRVGATWWGNGEAGGYDVKVTR